MYRDICLTNSEAITRWLDTYIAELSTMREHIAAHDRGMSETFAKAQQVRLQWQAAQNIDE
jgi:prephenate dehydrogenase